MRHRVVHQLRQFWKIKHGQKRETGLRHLAPSSLERFCLRNCNPSRVLVGPMALCGIVRTFSRMIHKRLLGNHSRMNVLMGVIKVSPSWSGSGLRVAQGVKLTSSALSDACLILEHNVHTRNKVCVVYTHIIMVHVVCPVLAERIGIF
jgi:hypothetical protein